MNDLPDPPAPSRGSGDRYAEAYGNDDTAGYASPDENPAPARSKASPLALAGVVLAGALGAGVWYIGDLQDREDGPSAACSKVSQLDGASTTSTATATAPSDGPFEGTPAAHFPTGTDGLTMPTPTTVPGWSAELIGPHLDTVKKALTFMLLDERALVCHDPTAVLPLFASADHEWVREAYRSPAQGIIGPQISPTARLANTTPRIKGRTTVRGITDGDLHPLEIATNYVIVYPFDTPNLGPGSRTAVVRLDVTWRIYPWHEVEPADRGLIIHEALSYAYGMDCAEFQRGFVAPDVAADYATGPVGSDHPDSSFYDPNRSINVEDNCGVPPSATPTTT